MTTTMDDQLLGDDDYDNEHDDVGPEMEEALLQDDDSDDSRDRNLTKRQTAYHPKELSEELDEQEDVLNLDVDEYFQDVDDKSAYEETQDRKRVDKFLSERNKNISKQNVQNNSENQALNAGKPNQIRKPLQNDSFKKQVVTRNNNSSTQNRRRGTNRSQFQNRPSFPRPNMQRDRRDMRRGGTVLINPRYRGIVQIDENNAARLAWDNSQLPSNDAPVIQPWDNSSRNYDQSQILNTLVTGIAATLSQSPPNFYEPPPALSQPQFQVAPAFQAPPPPQQPYHNGPAVMRQWGGPYDTYDMTQSQQATSSRQMLPISNNQLPPAAPPPLLQSTPVMNPRPLSNFQFNREQKSFHNQSGSYNSYQDYHYDSTNQRNSGQSLDFQKKFPQPPYYRNNFESHQNPNYQGDFDNKNSHYQNDFGNRNSNYPGDVGNRNSNYHNASFGNNSYNYTNENDTFNRPNNGKVNIQNQFRNQPKNNFNKYKYNNNIGPRENNFNCQTNQVQNNPPGDNKFNNIGISQFGRPTNQNRRNIEVVPEKMKMEPAKPVIENKSAEKPASAENNEEESEEDRLYRMKIEEQKKERERLLKLKEERRKLRLEQENAAAQSKDPTVQPIQPQNQQLPKVAPKVQPLKRAAPSFQSTQPQKRVIQQPPTAAPSFQQTQPQNQALQQPPRLKPPVSIQRNLTQKATFPQSNNISIVPQNTSNFNKNQSFANARESQHPDWTIKVSNNNFVQGASSAPANVAPPSGFLSNRLVLVKGNGNPRGNLGSNSNIRGTNDGELAADPGPEDISSFLTNRKILTKDLSLMKTRLVVVSNLSASTGQNKLVELSRGIGQIQKLQMDKQERQATILFKTVASAHAFFKKYQRYMLDLSMIEDQPNVMGIIN